MQGFSLSTVRLCRRPAVGFFICSAPPLAVARRAFPLVTAPSDLRNPITRFAFGPWGMQRYFGVKSENKPCKQDCTNTGFKLSSNPMKEMWRGTIEHKQSNLIQRSIKDVTESNQKTTDVHVTDKNHTVDDDEVAWCVRILPHSSHRDGTIYKSKHIWEVGGYRIDFTNREETRVEPKRLSIDTRCNPNPENWLYHMTCEMVQVFSLKLAKTTINSGPLQLYGYIAARDLVDDMLNYVFNRSRDDPIIVQEESIIEMTGPKRGIMLVPYVLFEFDMRIKNGEKEEDDLQLIDGIIEFEEMYLQEKPFTARIVGDYGDVDMCLANISNGVEATVEVAISELDNGFDLSISCVLFMMEKSKEFQLFGGTIGESCQLRRFVMAVFLDTVMHLKFKVDQKGSNVVEHCCSFESKLQGCASHQIKLENASILVKVTWSPLIE